MCDKEGGKRCSRCCLAASLCSASLGSSFSNTAETWSDELRCLNVLLKGAARELLLPVCCTHL